MLRVRSPLTPKVRGRVCGSSQAERAKESRESRKTSTCAPLASVKLGNAPHKYNKSTTVLCIFRLLLLPSPLFILATRPLVCVQRESERASERERERERERDSERHASYMYYMIYRFLCVCVCARARVCVYIHAYKGRVADHACIHIVKLIVGSIYTQTRAFVNA